MDKVPLETFVSKQSIFIGAIVIALLTALALPTLLKHKQQTDMAKAISHTKHLGLALSMFEHEYGSFPDAYTAEDVAKRTGSRIAISGDTANDYLRQLIASDIADQETMFYAKTAFSKKPDNRINTPAEALGPGELGFGYFMNGDRGFTNDENHPTPPNLPILCAPLAMEGVRVSSSQFDLDPYQGKAVLLLRDRSSTAVPIDPSTGSIEIDGEPWTGDRVGNDHIKLRLTIPVPKL